MSDTPGGPGWWMADDHKWYPPAEPNPAPPPAPTSSRSSSGRGRMVAVAAGAIVLLAAVVGAYVVGSSTSDPTSPSPQDETPTSSQSGGSTDSTADSTSTTPTADPAAGSTAEEDLRTAAVGSGPITAVAVIETPEGVVGVTLPSDANEIDQPPGAIQLWRMDGDTWVDDGMLETPATVSAWTVVDVTGDGSNDLVLDGVLGNDVVGMVVAVQPGAARLVPFADSDGTTSEMTGVLRFEADGLTSSDTPCVPSCAEGGVIDRIWTYDASTERFTS